MTHGQENIKNKGKKISYQTDALVQARDDEICLSQFNSNRIISKGKIYRSGHIRELQMTRLRNEG